MPRPPAEDSSISCPADGAVMSKVSLSGVTVDHCPSCGGIWLDGGELRAILDAGRGGRAQVDALEELGGVEPEVRPQPLLCPRDRQRMSVHRDPKQDHIEFDLCPKCGGVFFDAGELSDLTRHTLAERVMGMLG